MMRAGNGGLLGLNEVATRVWELIEVPREVADLCRVLEREFDVAPEICQIEVEELLSELVKYGAVALDPP
jgi:hypothetical protein